jgi:hypothetical protein
MDVFAGDNLGQVCPFVVAFLPLFSSNTMAAPSQGEGFVHATASNDVPRHATASDNTQRHA